MTRPRSQSYLELALSIAESTRESGDDLAADVIQELVNRLTFAYEANIDVLLRERERHCEYAVEALGSTFDPRGCFVYLIYEDDTDQPVYVGRSTNVLRRIGGHRGGHARDATRVSLIRCSNFRDMCVLEEALIRKHQPRFNRVGIKKAS